MKGRREQVADWLDLPMTRAFLAVLAVECRANREKAMLEASQGRSATQNAAWCLALRWAMDEAPAIVADYKEHKETIKDGCEAVPEELHSRGLADALPEGE